MCAVAFDAFSAAAAPNATNSVLSWAHTTTGTNPVLIIGVQAYALVAQADIVARVTYNSVLATRLSIQNMTAVDNYSLYYYYLINPATGTNQIDVECSPTPGFGAFWGLAATFTGANQAAFPDAQNRGTNFANSSVKGSVTTIADGAMLTMISGGDDGPIQKANGGTSIMGAVPVGFLSRGSILAASRSLSTISPAGLASISVAIGTGASPTTGTMIVAAIAPVAAAGGAEAGARTLAVTGVGQ